MSHYQTALICEKGHVLVEGLETSPEMTAPRCQQCGSPTLSQCPACGESIRGHYYVPGVIGISHYSRPSYCHQCGAPYPWTKAAVDAWREMADEAEGLTDQERQELAASIADLISDTPQTQLAVQRLKGLASKLATGTWEMMQTILVSVATDAAKKQLGLG